MASSTFWNPEIAKLQGQYKPATDRVLSWLRTISGHGTDTKVNYYRKLASDAARDGTPMPDDILDDLQNAINARTEAANWFRRPGVADPEDSHRHEHMIGVLQSILSAFCPSRPTTPLLGASPCSTLPSTPELSPMEYFPPQSFYPSYQPEYFPAYHLQQDWRLPQPEHFPAYHLQQDWRLPQPQFQQLVQPPVPAVPKAHLINNTNWRKH